MMTHKRSKYAVERVRDMFEMYRSGKTMQEIGDFFGITSQGVSARFNYHNLETSPHKKARKESKTALMKDLKKDTQDEKSYSIFGVSHSVSRAYSTEVRRAYTQQKLSACRRGVAWEINFSDWLSLWEDSGKFHLRGRGDGRYAMARRGDIGPYSVSNIEIITHNQNSKDCRYNTKNRK